MGRLFLLLVLATACVAERAKQGEPNIENGQDPTIMSLPLHSDNLTSSTNTSDLPHSHVESTVLSASRAVHCPNHNDIFPCVCTVEEESGHKVMDMDCSMVTSEKELASIFQAHFPFKSFRKLIIQGNANLKSLSEGDFGPVSFMKIHIEDGILTNVNSKALSGSYSTLQELKLNENSLVEFVFEEIKYFTQLTELLLTSNEITNLKHMESDSLKVFWLSNNKISNIPTDYFSTLPNLEQVDLGYNNIHNVTPGMFKGMANLNFVSLLGNEVDQIYADTISVTTTNPSTINLANMGFRTINANAVTGANNGNVYFYGNIITLLHQEVFEPFFEKRNKIHLRDNPLSCGCDLAWLIINPTYMALLDTWGGEARCFDGERLVDLDPDIYLYFC